MKKDPNRCLSCGGKLVVRRACPHVIICCDACGKSYPQEKYKDLIDDYWENKLANIPVNRL
ncbi:dual CXXC motif small (seleno)protein [uncultured Desulfobacter sp.]|uniref:dual CXXC motif small (seleno)protein n=1 Tax=uncultured Desulfobacter sp. TaxID=240139 RepID=UPI002AAB78C6|nr:dual CXXC motif small (seleno)protein [uncultured Desulfobacter sp.]